MRPTWRIEAIAAAFALVAAAASPTREAIAPIAAGDPIEYINSERYRVESVVTVTNGGFTLTELQVYQPKPINWDGQEQVTIEEVFPAGAVVEGPGWVRETNDFKSLPCMVRPNSVIAVGK